VFWWQVFTFRSGLNFKKEKQRINKMFQFAHKEYLYLLGVIPVLALLFIIALSLKKKAIRLFGDYNIISQLMPDVSRNRPVVKFILIAVGLAVLIT